MYRYAQSPQYLKKPRLDFRAGLLLKWLLNELIQMREPEACGRL